MSTQYRRGEAGTDGNSPIEGRAPGVMYGDGPQKQIQGMAGKKATQEQQRWAHKFIKYVKGKCGPLGDEQCLELFNWFLEQTFRNFHLNVAPRTNLEPPWTCRPIDPVQSGGLTTVTLQQFVTINSYSVAPGRIAIIRRLGQAANTPSAFGDTQWRIVQAATATIATSAGQAVFPWTSLTGLQYFSFSGDLIAKPIILVGTQPVNTVAWQVFVTTAGASYNVAGRLWGWEFAPLAVMGDQVGSAIGE